jgi:hypothetical protein
MDAAATQSLPGRASDDIDLHFIQKPLFSDNLKQSFRFGALHAGFMMLAAVLLHDVSRGFASGC